MSGNKKTKKKLKNLEEIAETHAGILTDLVDKIEDLDSRLEDVEISNKPYTGAIKMSLDRDEIVNYYMVSDLYMTDSYLEFYHLTSDERPVNVESFPAKDEAISIFQHIRNVYKDDRWLIVKEKIYHGSFAGIALIGEFRYKKPIKRKDYPYKFKQNESSVTPLKKQE